MVDITEQNEESENTLDKTKEERRDKIFGNDYNQGNLDLDYNKPLQIDLGFQNEYLNDCYSPEEYTAHHELLTKIYAFIESSKWAYILKRKKKVTNENIPQIYSYLKNNLNEKHSTNIQIFTAISDAVDIPFKTLYDNIGSKYKEEILSELDNKFSIFKKKKIKRLF